MLTVITVCLNRADTIGATLGSVARQLDVLPAGAIEHIVVDGGSTDGTGDIVAKFPHAKFVSGRDKGLYDAMNKGIALASGRYVMLLNSDDSLADGIVEATHPYMDAGYDAICFGADFVRREPDGTIHTIESVVAPDAIVLSETTATLGSPLVNAKILRKAFLERVGELDLRYRLAADVDLLLRAALAGPRVAVLPQVGLHYQEHAGSLTINRHGYNGDAAALECIAIAEKHLAINGVPRATRRLLKAWRGGKRLMLAMRNKQRAAANARAWARVLAGGGDTARYLSYLVKRKLTPPAKRLLDNLASMSQSRQDVWLMAHVFNGRRGGTFVEIGAYDGTSYSNCALMEGAYGWRGLCIEPNPQVFKVLCTRRLAEAMNIAVGSSSGTMQFRVAGMLSGIVRSYEAAHRDRVEREFGGEAAENVIDVPVRDLATVLAEQGLDHIDYMSIDAEGGESEILQGLAKSGVSVTVITLENNYASRDLRTAVERLGMLKVFELEADEVYVRRGTLPASKALRLQLRYLLSPRRIATRLIAPLARSILPTGLASHARKLLRWWLARGA